MKFYRLDSTKRKSPAEAFSGKGGMYVAGRWNSLGRFVVYASASIALAYLERLAHMDSENPEEELHLFEIDISDNLIEVPALASLPSGWNDRTTTDASRSFGDEWLKRNQKPALLIPSVIVEQENNVLINPSHPDFKLAWIKGPLKLRHDSRLKAPAPKKSK